MAITEPGNIWVIGNHRLMCADATDKAAVQLLMTGQTASLICTSPPYLNQRDYQNPISDWQTLMQDTCTNLPVNDATQIMVNLGIVHLDGEWQPYWQPWLDFMQTQGWRRFGLYVWDKQSGVPGAHHGRLAPAFEFVFHLNKQSRTPNKTVRKCPTSIIVNKRSTSYRKKNGILAHVSTPMASLNTHKIPDSVFRIWPERRRNPGHPAIMPEALPMQIIDAFTQPNDIVYDPFAGSGTTIIAAHKLDRIGYGIELAPIYCDVAIKRIQQTTGLQAYRLHDGCSFDYLTAPNFFERT